MSMENREDSIGKAGGIRWGNPAVIVAAISTLGIVVVAIITGVFNLLGNDAPQTPPIPTPTQSLAIAIEASPTPTHTSTPTSTVTPDSDSGIPTSVPTGTGNVSISNTTDVATNSPTPTATVVPTKTPARVVISQSVPIVSKSQIPVRPSCFGFSSERVQNLNAGAGRKAMFSINESEDLEVRLRDESKSFFGALELDIYFDTDDNDIGWFQIDDVVDSKCNPTKQWMPVQGRLNDYGEAYIRNPDAICIMLNGIHYSVTIDWNTDSEVSATLVVPNSETEPSLDDCKWVINQRMSNN